MFTADGVFIRRWGERGNLPGQFMSPSAVAGALKTLVFGMQAAPIPPASGGCFGSTLREAPWPGNSSQVIENILPALMMGILLASAAYLSGRRHPLFHRKN